MIAMLLEIDVDFVARLHHARKEDAYRVKRLGKRSYLVVWPRPDKPDWMDEETYNQMPETITLRQIEVKVEEQGQRALEGNWASAARLNLRRSFVFLIHTKGLSC